MSDPIYMIHPNQRLTKLDQYTIPNMEAYIRILEQQIRRILNHVETSSKGQITYAQGKLLRYKKLEKDYISSNLNVYKLLLTVDKCNSPSGYDYELEGEILDKVQKEMGYFNRAEADLAKLREEIVRDGEERSVREEDDKTFGIQGMEESVRRDSIVKVEDSHIENVKTESI